MHPKYAFRNKNFKNSLKRSKLKHGKTCQSGSVPRNPGFMKFNEQFVSF
jgi:hypothetical protein